jgi:hypothetical protein
MAMSKVMEDCDINNKKAQLDRLVVKCSMGFDLERIGGICASPRAVQQNLRFTGSDFLARIVIVCQISSKK